MGTWLRTSWVTRGPRVTTPTSPLKVQTAFGLSGACPASAARVGAGLHRQRAGGTANGWVSLVDERVQHDPVLGDVGVHLILAPARDRIDLDHRALRVPFDHVGVAARVG